MVCYFSNYAAGWEQRIYIYSIIMGTYSNRDYACRDKLSPSLFVLATPNRVHIFTIQYTLEGIFELRVVVVLLFPHFLAPPFASRTHLIKLQEGNTQAPF